MLYSRVTVCLKSFFLYRKCRVLTCVLHNSVRSSAIEKSTAHPEIITESMFALLGHFCVITYAIILTNVLFHIHTYMHTVHM